MSKNLVTQTVYGTQYSKVLKKYHIHFQVQKYDLRNLDWICLLRMHWQGSKMYCI
jgi:hypothetical protein